MEMKCIDCKSGELESRLAMVPIEIKGEEFFVEMQALVCSTCSYTTIDGSRMSELMRLGADAYRSKYGRLTSSEIKMRRRAWLKMSQAEFASYIGVSPISVKRWELGKVQDEAMDRLIRMRTDVETAKENYRRVVALTSLVVGAGIDAALNETQWEPKTRDLYRFSIKDWETELSAA
jgi:putative zinc finger/helix-turn-helix YgiT family protein